MPQLLKGKPVADSIKEKLAADVKTLNEKSIFPTIAIVRVGEKDSDMSYERSILKICETVGVRAKSVILPQSAGQGALENAIIRLNEDDGVHGILPFMPLPKDYDDEAIKNLLRTEKDIDGMTSGSAASVFSGSGEGFAPCTAEAVMKILQFYNLPISGKHACVIGRSMVIGKPVAMLLASGDATVTICHSKTTNMSEIAKNCDLVVTAIGKAKAIGISNFNPSQTVIDVGIHVLEDGSMCGDVDFDAVKNFVSAITPVPGGVGSVTTALLISHVVLAAEKMLKKL